MRWGGHIKFAVKIKKDNILGFIIPMHVKVTFNVLKSTAIINFKLVSIDFVACAYLIHLLVTHCLLIHYNHSMCINVLSSQKSCMLMKSRE